MKINPLNAEDRLLINRAFKYIKPYKLQFIAAFVCILSGIGLIIIQPLLWGKIITSLVDKNLDRALNIMAYILILYIAKIVIDFCQAYLFSFLSENLIFNMRKDMYDKILNLPVKAFDEIKPGEFISRLNGDVANIASILTNQLLNGIVDALRAIFVGITVFSINFILGLIVVAGFPFSYYVFYRFGKTLRNRNMEIARLYDKYYSNISESISGIREIKSLGIKDFNFNTFKQETLGIKNKLVRLAALGSIAQALSQGLLSISQVAVMAVGGLLILSGSLLLEHFIAFISYSGQFSSSLMNLTRLNSSIQQVMTSLERVFSLMDSLSYGSEVFGARHIDHIHGRIRFKGVTFKYTNFPVLEDISFDIGANSKIAIVGSSGSGKTTIFNLLLRFYDQNSGKIFIDDTDIREFDEKTLRKHISIVRQEPFLFKASIKENLLLAKPDAAQHELEEACMSACIHEYIAELPEKYDSIIEENGANLSGGQKQRIAIARALLKNSKIFLFDEATSSLDNESQYSIKKAIDTVSREHTVVIIAHRLSTIAQADNIIVIENGKIAGQGKHSSLILKNAIYQRLYKTETELLKENREEVFQHS